MGCKSFFKKMRFLDYHFSLYNVFVRTIKIEDTLTSVTIIEINTFFNTIYRIRINVFNTVINQTNIHTSCLCFVYIYICVCVSIFILNHIGVKRYSFWYFLAMDVLLRMPFRLGCHAHTLVWQLLNEKTIEPVQCRYNYRQYKKGQMYDDGDYGTLNNNNINKNNGCPLYIQSQKSRTSVIGRHRTSMNCHVRVIFFGRLYVYVYILSIECEHP